MARRKIKIGDQIRFKAATRGSFRTVVRKVKDFDHLGRPLVGYEGWSNFIVKPGEIKEVIPA